MYFKKNEWNASYYRKENFIFYPYEETVKFLNRFIRKRGGLSEFETILQSDSGKIKGLDLGCGIGRQTILLEEFGIEAYGLDISEEAIKVAKDFAESFSFPQLKNRLLVYNGKSIPFEDNYFDLSISCGVLDSVKFDLAKVLIKELDRVTSKISFITLISGDNEKFYREYDGEEVVQTEHEYGTIQSYFNWSKIEKLLSHTNFRIHWARLIEEHGINHKYKNGRYYIVLTKEECL